MFKRALTLALFAGAAALPSTANASIQITGEALLDGATTGIVTVDNPSPTADYSTPNIYIGRITLTGTDLATNPNQAVSFAAYCIDIYDFLHAGLFDVVPLVSYSSVSPNQPLTNAQKTQLLKLVSNADPLLNANRPNNDISAAIQLAVWEIVYEDASTPYNLSSGRFSANTSAGAIALANTYLGHVTTDWTAQAGYSLNTLVAQTQPNQEQLFLISTPVPEPATWAMMIAGFGVVGGAMRVKRRQTRIAFA